MAGQDGIISQKYLIYYYFVSTSFESWIERCSSRGTGVSEDFPFRNQFDLMHLREGKINMRLPRETEEEGMRKELTVYSFFGKYAGDGYKQCFPGEDRFID